MLGANRRHPPAAVSADGCGSLPGHAYARGAVMPVPESALSTAAGRWVVLPPQPMLSAAAQIADDALRQLFRAVVDRDLDRQVMSTCRHGRAQARLRDSPSQTRREPQRPVRDGHPPYQGLHLAP